MTIDEYKKQLELMTDKVVNFSKYKTKVGRGPICFGKSEFVEETPSQLLNHKKRLRKKTNGINTY